MNASSSTPLVVKRVVNGADESQYAAIIVALGFEERSRHVAEVLSRRASARFAAGFTDRQVLSFRQNCAALRRLGFTIDMCADDEFKSWCDRTLAHVLITHRANIRICVDVSSFSRFRLAVLFEALRECSMKRDILVDFMYSPAEFSRPHRVVTPVTSAQPISPQFAGWSDEPELPSAVIVGLGYEEQRALGAIEYMEPGEVWAFRPVGQDSRYDVQVKHANSQVWEQVRPERLVDYRVAAPYECFVDMESLAYGLQRTARLIVLPFGPKLFTIISLCVAVLHAPSIGVWRVTAGSHEEPAQRRAAGTLVGLATEFSFQRFQPTEPSLLA